MHVTFNLFEATGTIRSFPLFAVNVTSVSVHAFETKPLNLNYLGNTTFEIGTINKNQLTKLPKHDKINCK